ncbi:MAG: hypothetical protein FJZ58_02510 [Chlamydiae bacterium]|nr:hypothetical protein [Chlamydiota bacterium]
MHQSEAVGKQPSTWEAVFSACCARVFFLLLLVLDALWFAVLLGKMAFYAVLQLVFFGSSVLLYRKMRKVWVSIKRSLICALALVVALFSPAFGIMIGCTYFLMYDKQGVEEVVPSSIREQFKDVFVEMKKIDN